MARTTPARQAWRSLAGLGAIIAVLAGILGAGVLWSTATWTPKLALDLEGGTQIILGAQLSSGQQLSAEQLNQAVGIIRERIDASGVAEAEVSTQGDRNVVVAIPGEPDEATLARIQSTAKLDFRPVIFTAAPTVQTIEPQPTETVGPDGETITVPPTPFATTATATPTDASDPNWVSDALYAEFLAFDCATLATADLNLAPADQPLITCADNGAEKYILGPVEVDGADIADASSGQVPNSQGQLTGVWGVFITFDGDGTEKFGKVTERLYGYPETDPRNRFAIVLDGRVISAPTTQAIISDGKPVISGSFTQESSKILADQLKFGALPIAFEVLSNETISATLGGTQLNSGLIAGLIGLILVVGYSIFQYRTLASVTIASLVVAAVLTYLIIAIFSWRIGYRLSLAGVAGLIVAIGLTVDSFIVYFERIRDELRDGRSLPGAVEAGWKRALRTVLAAKAINLISAVVLYILAIGNVRGFAFTLGITVVIDVLVVVLFTHPMMQLLATTRFFSSGHPASGLDPNALGAVYRGRAQFRAPVLDRTKSGAAREAQRRQTIAERKAMESAGSEGKDN